MFENAHAIVGVIELLNCPGGATTAVDDSSLDRLLASLAAHDSLADELSLPSARARQRGWQECGADSGYHGCSAVLVDMEALVNDLEQEYAQLCDALDS